MGTTFSSTGFHRVITLVIIIIMVMGWMSRVTFTTWMSGDVGRLRQ